MSTQTQNPPKPVAVNPTAPSEADQPIPELEEIKKQLSEIMKKYEKIFMDLNREQDALIKQMLKEIDDEKISAIRKKLQLD